MDMSPEQALEMRLARLEEDIREIQATLDIAINYMQCVAEALGLRHKTKLLEEQLDEVRARKSTRNGTP
jgi:hypothetical protein